MDGFIKISYEILQDTDLTPIQILLLGVIDSLCQNKEGKCWASNQYLGELLRLNERSIRRNLKVLVDKGYLKMGVDTNVLPVGHKCPKMRTLMSTNNISNNKHISKDICYTHELVEAYKNDSQLPKMMDDLEIVEERVEYKQAKKSRAYKKVKGFLQQMKVSINTVRNNEIRGDTKLRFRFAVNQSMEKERKGIFRNDKIEAEYQARKKLYLLEQKQNE